MLHYHTGRLDGIGGFNTYHQRRRLKWDRSKGRGDQLGRFKNYLDQNCVRFEHIHTSGHATISSLKKLVEAIKPNTIIPMHSFHPEQFAEHFPNVKMLHDGNVFALA